MKFLFLVPVIFSFSILCACAQNRPDTKESFSNSIILKAQKLRQLYLLSTASSSGINDTYKQKFFEEFPDTFRELNEAYGYDNNKPSILYNDAEKHIVGLFNNLNTIIDDTLYYRKIISIAIGGHWDVDAVNYFQNGLIQRVQNNPKLIVYLLMDMPEKKIKSFWFFYFDGPHPKKQIAEPLQGIKLISNKVYNLMMQAQSEVLEQSH